MTAKIIFRCQKLLQKSSKEPEKVRVVFHDRSQDKMGILQREHVQKR